MSEADRVPAVLRHMGNKQVVTYGDECWEENEPRALIQRDLGATSEKGSGRLLRR